MRVSVICTVLNEKEAIGRLLDSLAAQTRPPDEVVIVDGGSTDGTQAAILGYAGRLPLKLSEARGANISRGRNLAVRRSTGEVIASTDAGVWLEPQWLEHLLEPLAALPAEERRRSCRAVAGFFQADPRTTFELALGATTLPMADEIKPDRFLPSSRSVAFTRVAFEASGGYPEWLDYCEDLIFDFRVLDRCGPFAWAPQAVAHFRPRPTLGSFFKQYYRYARGDGKADLWRKRHAIRYGTYLVALPLLLLLTLLHHPAWSLALLAGMAAYCRRPVLRLRRQWAGYGWPQRLAALLLIPVIRATGDVAKMLGYPAGWRWRLANRHRPELRWREELDRGGEYG
ncbi:MAG: glycosyltransferase [Caldilineales bacterium]|nr:glycosyltransferase [Caldilineales bacterium]MDW8316465.1 glycosyltransferase [Anaerolineae bacterium]